MVTPWIRYLYHHQHERASQLVRRANYLSRGASIPSAFIRDRNAIRERPSALAAATTPPLSANAFSMTERAQSSSAF